MKEKPVRAKKKLWKQNCQNNKKFKLNEHFVYADIFFVCYWSELHEMNLYPFFELFNRLIMTHGHCVHDRFFDWQKYKMKEKQTDSLFIF